MSSDATRMCELLVGLPAVTVLKVLEDESGLRVKVQTRGPRLGGGSDLLPADTPC